MTKINPNLIEILSVNKITTLAARPGSTLETSIPTGDKGVSFDGHIAVYKDDSLSKASLIGRIPVQVKGKGVEIFSPLQAKYSADIDDLRNYYTEGGVIYFVCEVNGNAEVVVFAKVLLPLDLKQIISQFGHQGTATIYLSHVKDNKTLEFICNNFLREKNRQPKEYIEKHAFNADEFEKLKITRVSFEPNKGPYDIINQDMYLYGLRGNIEFPISIVKFEKISHKGDTYIDIQGEQIPFQYELSESSEISQITFEHSFRITFNRKIDSVTFKVLKHYSLESYWKSLKLLEKIISEESINLFDGSIQISDLILHDGEFANLEEEIQWVEKLKDLYSKIGIPHDYVSKGTDESLVDYSSNLYRAFIERNYEKVLLPTKPEANLLVIRLGKDHILTFYSPEEEEKIMSVAGTRFLQKDIVLEIHETFEKFNVSPFLLAEPRDLLTAANVSLELVKDSFKPDVHIYKEGTFNITNNFCLKCLNAYDTNKITDYLDLVEAIYIEMLQGEYNEVEREIATINYLQTLFRKNGMLTDEQLDNLIELKENPSNTDNFVIRTCCNVLASNKAEAKYFFNKMDADMKTDFECFPIYTLYKELIEIE
ncbi:hypothetical protein PGC35_20765 [Psychrobacillus sp. PGGUH221]|uniref:hypothetical protein n=1 Tax=Psychrobacillus sp. PGGUH221 TaxID=3020058 RepID=UPI0035C696E1